MPGENLCFFYLVPWDSVTPIPSYTYVVYIIYASSVSKTGILSYINNNAALPWAMIKINTVKFFFHYWFLLFRQTDLFQCDVKAFCESIKNSIRVRVLLRRPQRSRSFGPELNVNWGALSPKHLIRERTPKQIHTEFTSTSCAQ